LAHPPLFDELTDAQKIVMGYETARQRAHEYDQHFDQISHQFADLIEEGRKVGDDAYQFAVNLRDRANAILDQMFNDTDAILAPSAPGAAPEGLNATGDPLYSRLWNLLQLPCVALPFGANAKGLPTGIQLIGRKGQDAKLLDTAQWVSDQLSAS
jgi:Asp-tRNA(Asn)/Glu-tRNA(Gln) amidotransferase A subunit family amidase